MQSFLFKILLVFLTNSSLLFSQESNFETDIKNEKIDYYITIEKQLKSKTFDTGQNYITPYAQPLVFIRKEKGIPNLLVYYYFSKNDSIVKKILYEWDVNNFEDNDNNTKPLSFDKKMIEKYTDLLSMITSKHGKSNSTGNLDDLSKINTDGGLKKGDKWNTDNSKIDLYLTLSNYYHKEGIVSTVPTHKIRYYIVSEETSKKNTDDIEKQNTLNNCFNKFIYSVENNNLEEAKNVCSLKIRHTITQELITQIKPVLVSENKLVPYMNGMQIMQDGNSYPMIKYKYENDTNSPPKKHISVIFDSDNTILAIQPMERP